MASRAVLILEPARAALTGLAVRLGLSEEIEEAGNRVHRLAAGDVSTSCARPGSRRSAWRRTLMYYPHEPFGWFRWFDPPPCFGMFRAGVLGDQPRPGPLGEQARARSEPRTGA